MFWELGFLTVFAGGMWSSWRGGSKQGYRKGMMMGVNTTLHNLEMGEILKVDLIQDSSSAQGWKIEKEVIVNDAFGVLGIAFNGEKTRTITEIMGMATLETAPTLAPFIQTELPGLAKKYRLGIVSDTGLTSARFLRRLLSRDKIISHFTALGFSDEMGYSKPEPTIFHLTLQQLGVASSESVHIGDLVQTDIRGAKSAGMRTIQYANGAQKQYNNDFKTGNQNLVADAIIDNFRNIKAVIDNW